MKPYSVTFIHALDYLLRAEGGYVNDPADRGGETKYGISKRAYPHLNIAALTEEQATDIYYRDYWLKAKCDQLPPGISLMVFDGIVQHGSTTAIQQLQRAPGVTDDGIIGQRTLISANTTMVSVRFICQRILTQRSRTYARIVANNPSQAKFISGWFNRLDSLMLAVEEVVG
ncbi:peptidoglycan-binding protein [Limnobaculum zhutongyuii]|uniref:Peptidoglycan-binding protein n=1 Tax=Limnobaculum zhutongyuii TaxID=2498113 RepID=A0A411WKP7_9GAMM|nr:N-acetylmuramidase [Limnobaculum zhutongyuii]QBH96801.1 peptidoglycan-binding protein [Limnobaculum zhutongyuii]TQS90168.1 peptidoglycan-binding protein [Limnobaculum zhutongyuii]